MSEDEIRDLGEPDLIERLEYLQDQEVVDPDYSDLIQTVKKVAEHIGREVFCHDCESHFTVQDLDSLKHCPYCESKDLYARNNILGHVTTKGD